MSLARKKNANPNNVIQSQLQLLRSQKEQEIAEIDVMEQEKSIIEKIIPKVLYELHQLQGSIQTKQKEAVVFNHAIEEIEKNYGEFLLSADYFKADN